MSRLLVSVSVCLLASVVAVRPAAAADPKVDLCHVAGKKYQPISVAASALAAHLGHGDVQQPNGAVPGNPGAAFDSACNVVSWVYGVNTAPDPSAIDPASPGNLFVGSGIPAVNFGTATNSLAGVELGLMVLYRQGPTLTTLDDYNDGVLNFNNVASGPQSTANGSSGNHLGRAAWNYTFSIATGLNGATTDLTDFTFKLLVDLDPGAGTSYMTLTLVPSLDAVLAGQSGFDWQEATTSGIVMSDDEGTASVTQNSQNYAFYGALPPLNASTYTAPNGFAGPAKFDIVLQAFDGAQLIAQNHIAVNVAP